MKSSVASCLLFCCVPLCADFQYQSTARITGGAMLQMLRFVPGAGKIRDPQVSTVAVKGNRMVRQSAARTEIIDLDKRTITTIDAQKRQYSVMTFDQMKEALDKMAASSQANKQPGAPDMSIDAHIRNAGQSRIINGYQSKEAVLTMSMTITDPRSGQSGVMNMNMDMWVAPEVAGYSEVRDFYRRMAKELNWMPGGAMLLNRPDIARAMGHIMSQSGAIDGTPIEQVLSMLPAGTAAGGTGAPAAPGQDGSGSNPADASTSNMGSASNPNPAAASNPNPAAAGGPTPSSAIAGALAGRLGGLSGFGRRKQAQTAPAQDSGAANANVSAAGGSGSLIEMTIDNTNFSAAPVDASLFEVPPGFREAPPDVARTGAP